MATTPVIGGVNPSALDWAKQILASWGLSTLSGQLASFVKDGMTSDQLSFALQETKEYKERFSGNAIRKAAGLPELQPAQYVAVEEQYHQIMQSYGLPAGFYDEHKDFTKFIGGDVSPQELESRVKIASTQWQNADPETKSVWKNYYGLDDGHAIASILDQNTALPIIEQRAQAVGIGAAAANAGVSLDKSRAEKFAQFGTTVEQAKQAYAEIAQALPDAQRIGNRFGESFGQSELENANILGVGEDLQKQQRLIASEKSSLTGAVAADTKTVAGDQNY